MSERYNHPTSVINLAAAIISAGVLVSEGTANGNRKTDADSLEPLHSIWLQRRTGEGAMVTIDVRSADPSIIKQAMEVYSNPVLKDAETRPMENKTDHFPVDVLKVQKTSRFLDASSGQVATKSPSGLKSYRVIANKKRINELTRTSFQDATFNNAQSLDRFIKE